MNNRKESSAAKVAANRKNSLKSTGPKTEQGKCNSKFNALKHGLLARHAVLPGPEAPDKRHEFKKLLDKPCTEKKPVGVLEMYKVEEIALCMFRAQRAVRFEATLIRKNCCEAVDREEPEPIVQPSRKDELHKTCKGLRVLIAILYLGLRDLQKNGQLQPGTRTRLKEFFPLELACWEDPDDNGGGAKSATSTNSGERLASRIKGHIDFLEEMSRRKAMRDFEIDVGMGLVPREEDLQRLNRYEGFNDRKMHRSLEELHRLQEQRLKECHGDKPARQQQNSAPELAAGCGEVDPPQAHRRSETQP